MMSISSRSAVVLAVMGLLACGGSQEQPNDPNGGTAKGGTGGTGGTGGRGTGDGGQDSSGGTSGSGGSAGKSGSAGKGGSSGKGGSAGKGGSSGGSATGGSGPALPPGCTLEAPAFCETFDTPHPGGRGGEIDERVWQFSRWKFDRLEAGSAKVGYASTWSNPDGPPLLCGELFSGLLPPDDVRVCSGQLEELFEDGQSLPINSFMARKPFDFTDRTGTIVFDVDAKRNDGWDGHGWWLEAWVTEEPSPIPYHGAPGVASFPRNGIGIQIAPFHDAFYDINLNAVTGLAVSRDYKLVRDMAFGHPDLEGPAFRVKDQKMNRFRIELNKDTITVYASDWDNPTELRQVLKAENLDLNFSVGFVHFQHIHYNASKVANCACDTVELQDCSCDCGSGCANWPNGFYASSAQTYRWDNIGFDGPVHPAVRGYDVPNNDEDATTEDDGITTKATYIGYKLSRGNVVKVEVEGVDLTDAASASFNFNYLGDEGEGIRIRFNGNAWHDYSVPNYGESGYLLRALNMEVPLSDLVEGTNSIELDGDEPVGNLDLTIHPSR